MILNIEFLNLDLVTVGLTIAAILILGFVLFFNDPKSETNKSFLWLAMFATLWSIANYLNYQVVDETFALWLVRSVMFFAVWFAFYVFKFFYTFPSQDKKLFKNKTLRILLYFWIIFLSLFTLTPFVFSGLIRITSTVKTVPQPIVEKGIIFFGITTFLLLVSGIAILVKKTFKVKPSESRPFVLVLIGTIITFTLIFVFNFIFPSYINDVSYIPYGAVFIFPFVSLTAYATYKHKLFNLKVVATAFISFLVTIFSFINVIFSAQLSEVILNITAFIIILFGTIQLIRSELMEIQQREKIELLAKDLQKANDRLKELDKQKTEFVSFATHQLRAPLTAIKGYASLILEDEIGMISKEVRQSITRIYESSKSLAVIVDDYLNISRIELGTMSYSFEFIDFKELMENVIGELKPNIDKSNLTFKFTTEPSGHKERFMIHADEEKFKQVILNIIDNSIKYTPAGSIEIKLKKDSDNRKITLSIKDTGVGIAPEVMPKLFAKFVRADNANKQNIYGTGLGLFVAKEIVAAHHGRIWAESQGEGKGSTFIIEIDMAV